MQIMREISTSANVKIAGSGCAASGFAIHANDVFDIARDAPTHARRLKRRCANSESRFLAIKKFLALWTSRLAGARQNRRHEPNRDR
jgi:hypothetical protein